MAHALCAPHVAAVAATFSDQRYRRHEQRARTGKLRQGGGGGNPSSQYTNSSFRAARVVITQAAYGAGEVEASIAELRSLLEEAVAGEDYKNAAKIRDELL